MLIHGGCLGGWMPPEPTGLRKGESVTLDSRSWLPAYTDRRLTRRKFLGATAAGAAARIACGGGDSTPQVITVDPNGVRRRNG